MPVKVETCYFSDRGRYNILNAKLWKLIPQYGSVKNPRINKHLEKYRKACAVYYDLWNNGLGNRASEFRKVMDIKSSDYSYWQYSGRGSFKKFNNELYVLAEAKMDELIIRAAIEQGIL
jgi:hypothetical protein